MNFFKQIPAEAKNMLRSKFILISLIVMFLLIVVGFPVFSYVSELMWQSNYSYYGYEEDPIIIDGVEYTTDSEMGWEYRYLSDQLEYMGQSTAGVALEMSTDLTEALLEFYGSYIPYATTDYREGIYDYRERLSYQMRDNIIEKYLLNYGELNEAALNEVQMWVHFDTIAALTYDDLTDAEKQQRIDEIDAELAAFDGLMVNNDFSKYVEIQKANHLQDIEATLERIETLEADLLKNPAQEEFVSQEIEGLLLDIERIENTSIPMLDYRLENNVVIDDGSWQDSAIQTMESSLSRIMYLENDIENYTEEEFLEDSWLVQQYGTFDAYIQAQRNELIEAQENLFIAESSISNDKPDMSFVDDGARQNLYNSFMYLMIIMVFAVLIGGWAISSEFQSGTVRLLMIRPRTRIKVLFSRYIAGLKIILLLFFAVFIVQAIVYGFMYGFSDYGYPNYTANGEQNFFLMLIAHIFACSSAVAFIYSLSYTVSVLSRNIAVSIIVPVLIIFGAATLMAWLAQQPAIDILAFTPLPYITMYDFFVGNYNSVTELVSKGMPLSLELGIAVMLIYSAVLMAIATFVFKKKDITN